MINRYKRSLVVMFLFCLGALLLAVAAQIILKKDASTGNTEVHLPTDQQGPCDVAALGLAKDDAVAVTLIQSMSQKMDVENQVARADLLVAKKGDQEHYHAGDYRVVEEGSLRKVEITAYPSETVENLNQVYNLSQLQSEKEEFVLHQITAQKIVQTLGEVEKTEGSAENSITSPQAQEPPKQSDQQDKQSPPPAKQALGAPRKQEPQQPQKKTLPPLGGSWKTTYTPNSTTHTYTNGNFTFQATGRLVPREEKLSIPPEVMAELIRLNPEFRPVYSAHDHAVKIGLLHIPKDEIKKYLCGGEKYIGLVVIDTGKSRRVIMSKGGGTTPVKEGTYRT